MIIVKLVEPGGLGRVMIVGENPSDNVTITGDLIFEMPGRFGAGEKVEPEIVYDAYRFRRHAEELVEVLIRGAASETNSK